MPGLPRDEHAHWARLDDALIPQGFGGLLDGGAGHPELHGQITDRRRDHRSAATRHLDAGLGRPARGGRPGLVCAPLGSDPSQYRQPGEDPYTPLTKLSLKWHGGPRVLTAGSQLGALLRRWRRTASPPPQRQRPNYPAAPALNIQRPVFQPPARPRSTRGSCRGRYCSRQPPPG